eukprot:1146156-Pelagomonas_calceolata.AAC.2
MDTGDLSVMRSKMICAANVHGGKACFKRAFADTCKKNPAGIIVALESFCFEWKCGYGPEGVADILMKCGKETLIARAVSCFGVGISKSVLCMHVRSQSIIKVGKCFNLEHVSWGILM